MSSSIVRRASGTITKRHISSHTAKCHGSLPSAKMRALISLYHQAETFITPENLSERIDNAFTTKDLHSKEYYPITKLDDLKILVKERRSQARFTENDGGVRTANAYTYKATTMDSNWEGSKALREQRVIDALYGVDAGGKPGLEVLEESAERLQQNQAEDSKHQRND